MDSQEKQLKSEFKGTDVKVQRQGDDIAVIMPGNVAFATGSAELSSGFYSSLDAVADVLTKNPDTTITIAGHTDSVGNADANQQLSQNRASAVARYLVNKGISSQRIQAVGFGDRQPVATNDTEEGRAKNRRVVIQIHPKQQ
jgi:outer membrane protein OmpA-like peptidoglycan-associated protein